MLLEDEEWAAWSNHEVARRCTVSAEFVRQVRMSLATVASEPTPKTYTTKHGTFAAMAGWEREQARRRQAARLKQGDDFPSPSIDANGESGRTAEILAGKAGVGQSTVERAIKVRETGTDALNAKVAVVASTAAIRAAAAG